jgi:site-specific recombinase XerD
MAARIVIDPALEAVVEAFGVYQGREKRLAELSVQMSSYPVRAFLAWRVRSGRGELGELEPGELSEYVVEAGGRLRASSMRTVVQTLRGFVRFLYVSGVTATDLSAALPSVPSSRFAALPKALDEATVAALLASCKRTRPTGLRDFAVMTLMLRLGLRAVEITRLTLEDIDWRAGEITVRGKGGRPERLPLPADVGEAIADYLCHGRRLSADRSVFLAARGQAVGMSRQAVVLVPREASKRAGIADVGGHRLRHTAATRLLRAGASLGEIAQVLRHSGEVATAIYAKVDQAALAGLARPWPDGGGQ